MKTRLAIGASLALALATGCAPLSSSPPSATADSHVTTSVAESAASAAAISAQGDPERKQVPLEWNIEEAFLVGRQGTTPLWGACGECCIANTLNLVTGSTRTESEIVDYVLENNLCVPETGGMTLDDMVDAYTGLLPHDSLDVLGFGGDYAPTLDDMAARLENGIILNVSVYGEMMREGGHTGEGEVAHGVERNDDGSVAGFDIVDSASDTTYLTAQELSDIYYGHDGTTIKDPCCVEVFGWTA